MDTATASPRYGPDYTPKMVTALASCTASIARLDARILVSSVGSAWRKRAAWIGYARALQLQSVEIDEIDVFSWGCELKIAGRALRASIVDIFEEFAPWQTALGDPDPFAWRNARPLAFVEPDPAAAHPPIVRALEMLRRDSRADRSIVPWLGLPFMLRDLGVCAAPLPCLTGGAKAFRLRKTLGEADWLTALRALEASAQSGIAHLDELDRHHRLAQRAIANEYRPGALPRLLALTSFRPLLAPQSVATLLGMSVAGASKLLERAAEAGLLVEISRRRSWRQFLTPDLATAFGFIEPRRGRPRNEPLPLPTDPKIAEAYDAFDREMAEIDAMLESRALNGTNSA